MRPGWVLLLAGSIAGYAYSDYSYTQLRVPQKLRNFKGKFEKLIFSGENKVLLVLNCMSDIAQTNQNRLNRLFIVLNCLAFAFRSLNVVETGLLRVKMAK